MKLLAIRDINANDPLPGLGKTLLAPAAPAAPNWTRSSTNPDIIIRPDGKMETKIFANFAARIHSQDSAADPPTTITSPIKVRAGVQLKFAGPVILKRDNPPAPRQAKAGDRVRILSGQPGIKGVNALVGTVQVVTGAYDSEITVCGWRFHSPGVTNRSGSLTTEFADAKR